jgi:hypothetical protein
MKLMDEKIHILFWVGKCRFRDSFCFWSSVKNKQMDSQEMLLEANLEIYLWMTKIDFFIFWGSIQHFMTPFVFGVV